MLLDISATPHTRTAALIAARIAAFAPTQQRKFVLVLPPALEVTKVYLELARMCHAGLMTFEHVVVFTTHEYVGVPPDHPSSSMLFMEKHLFSQVDLPPAQALVPLGTHPDPLFEAASYEARLQAFGPAHLVLLALSAPPPRTPPTSGGMDISESPYVGSREGTVAAAGGCKGHARIGVIGGGSGVRACAVVNLPPHAADNFVHMDGLAKPTHAISLGLSNFSDAGQVLIYAPPSTSATVQQAVEGPISHLVPASWFQFHPDAILLTDHAGADRLDPSTIATLSLLNTNPPSLPLDPHRVIPNTRPLSVLMEQEEDSVGVTNTLTGDIGYTPMPVPATASTSFSHGATQTGGTGGEARVGGEVVSPTAAKMRPPPAQSPSAPPKVRLVLRI